MEKTGIEAARVSWAECERQLYAMVVSDPSRYEQAILAVRNGNPITTDQACQVISTTATTSIFLYTIVNAKIRSHPTRLANLRRECVWSP